LRLAGLDANDVAVGVGEGEGVVCFGGGDVLLAKKASSFAEAFGLEGDAGFGAEGGGGNDLDLLAGVSGKVEEHGAAGEGFEFELVDVEVAGGRGVLHGEGDGDELVGDAIGAEVLAAIFKVTRAGLVLGVLDVLGAGGLEGAVHSKEEVACASFADVGARGEATRDVVVVDGLQVDAFEAEMEEGGVGIFFGGGVELDKLVVVDLDEGLVDCAVFAKAKGLIEA